MASSSEQPEGITRRQFLKSSGLTLAWLSLPRWVKGLASEVLMLQAKEEEEINSFDFLLQRGPTREPTNEQYAAIFKGLLGFGDMIGFQGDDRKRRIWIESVGKAFICLKREYRLCSELGRNIRRNAREFVLVSRDLYELSSLIWLYLKLKDDFTGKDEELRNQINSEAIYDYIIKNYALKIESNWMYRFLTNTFTAFFPSGFEREDLFNPYSFDDIFPLASRTFGWLPPLEWRRTVLANIGKLDGAQQAEIIDDMVGINSEQILEKLQELELSRVSETISFVRDDDDKLASGGYSPYSTGEIIVRMPTGEAYGSDSLSRDTWNVFYHELGHAVYNLIHFLPDRKAMEFRARIFQALSSFSPVRSVEGFISPSGSYRSRSYGERRSSLQPFTPQLPFDSTYIDEATITQYPFGYFVRRLWEETRVFCSGLNLIVIGLPYEYDDESYIPVLRGRKLKPVEATLVKRAKELLEEFTKRSERVIHIRDDFHFSSDPAKEETQKLSYFIPLALLDLALNNREKLIDLVLESDNFLGGFSGKCEGESLRAEIRGRTQRRNYVEKLVDGFLQRVQDFSIEDIPGDELFAELFSAALRKDDEGVEVAESTRVFLTQFRELINDILACLVENNLARRREDGKTIIAIAGKKGQTYLAI